MVKVEGKDGFSNWAARNAGAAQASGEFVVFCDADTMLRARRAGMDRRHTSTPRAYGHFERQGDDAVQHHQPARSAFNQLRGFHVLPARLFVRFGGL